MCRILDCYKTNTMFLGFIDCHLHTMRTNVQTQTKVSIDKRSRFRFFQHFNWLVGPQNALVHAVAVDWLQTS